MGLSCSSLKSPNHVSPPTHASDLLSRETADMSAITRVVNDLNLSTLRALTCARALKNDQSLGTMERQLASQAELVFKVQGCLIKDMAGELGCFNKTFDRVAKKLTALRDSEMKRRVLLTTRDARATAEGYTVPWLQNEVVRHRRFVRELAQKGQMDIDRALSKLNTLTDQKGMPPVSGVAESWHAANSL